MILYLVRHAEAKKEEEDPLKPLSKKGYQDIKKVASFISRLNVRIDRIYHSNKLRAKQTAEILAENLKPTSGVQEAEGLAPLDDPAIWLENLKGITETPVLVGHLPHLERLATFLLCGSVNKNFIAFKSASILCLKREDDGTWMLQWMLTPEIIS